MTTKQNTGFRCKISAVGKRRDGGTRFWCSEHGADATAKYGKRSSHCRYAHIPPVQPNEIVVVDLDLYKGGVGIWGAVPPVFDTTRLPLDRGIHVHARREPGSEKELDQTYRRVRLRSGGKEIEINELDAIYFMTSVVFGKQPQEVICTHCGSSHLDKDWFSVHPHKSHLCAACGKNFRDDKVSVGNPAARAIQLQDARSTSRAAKKPLSLKQSDYPGGIQIWGSNQAILWTVKEPERVGIHVHAYASIDAKPVIDETFSSVKVDGISLESHLVRTYMAQMALPHLAGRVVIATCPHCRKSAFDSGDDAFTPAVGRTCRDCGHVLASGGRFRKIVSNPLLGALALMAKNAVREPQSHDLGLIPETL